jgi:hypothetical protein
MTQFPCTGFASIRIGSSRRLATASPRARGEIIRRTWVTLFLPFLLGQTPAPKVSSTPEQAARIKRERLLEIYTSEAASYTIYRDANRQEKVELQREPVYVWTNPVREGGQDGVVFVWTCRGRAEILGSFFSFPATGKRDLYHEFHSLSLSVLDVKRPAPHTWTPEAPGIELVPIADAPLPARLAPQRLVQMRALTREFSASTEDDKGKSWELRLLPQPLYRYESTDPELLDGALFSFVTSAGTDPEAVLVLEARKLAADRDPVWQVAAARFTDLNLWVRQKGKVILTALRIEKGSPRHYPKERYRIIQDRTIPAVEEQAQ